MNLSKFPGLNYILITLFILVLGGIQTTLWFSFFGSFTAPPLWLIVIMYIYFYRKTMIGTFFGAFLCMVLTSFTAAPLKMLIISTFILSMIINFAKRRVFWGGHAYFVMASTGSFFLFNIIYILLSRFLDPIMTPINFGERILQLIMTPFASYLIYKVLYRIDEITFFSQQVETGGVEV